MKRHLTTTAIVLIALFFGVEATALDAYEDRRGLFLGIGIGGGVGAATTTFDGDQTGLDEGRQLGLNLSATLGGGANEFLTLGGQGNWWIRTVKVGSRSLSHQHLNFLADANLFFFDGFYGEGGVGLAYAVFDTARNSETTFTYRELGLAAKVGAGYEFFMNGTTAVGFNASYTRHFYNNANFDTVNGAITVRWY